MPIGESHSLRGEPVDMRRRDFSSLRVVTLHITIAKVICQDNDDIWSLGGIHEPEIYKDCRVKCQDAQERIE